METVGKKLRILQPTPVVFETVDLFRSLPFGRGSRVEGRGSRVEGRGSRVEGRGSRVEGRGSRVEGRGSRVEGRGSRVEKFFTIIFERRQIKSSYRPVFTRVSGARFIG